MNRRDFFGLLTGVLGALGLKAKAKAGPAKPIELESMKPRYVAICDQIYEGLDRNVRWGPGKEHPHWRVPQGKWTFVEDQPTAHP